MTYTVTNAPASCNHATVDNAAPVKHIAHMKTNMTAAQATEWVYDQDEAGEVDQDALEAAFAALYGRPADDDDREAGLWSLCCAATPGCGTRPEA